MVGDAQCRRCYRHLYAMPVVCLLLQMNRKLKTLEDGILMMRSDTDNALGVRQDESLALEAELHQARLVCDACDAQLLAAARV